MEEVSKTKFKAKMFEYLRRVEETGTPLLLSNFGKATIIIQPYQQKRSFNDIFAPFRGKVKFEESALLESTEADWIESED